MVRILYYQYKFYVYVIFSLLWSLQWDVVVYKVKYIVVVQFCFRMVQYFSENWNELPAPVIVVNGNVTNGSCEKMKVDNGRIMNGMDGNKKNLQSNALPLSYKCFMSTRRESNTWPFEYCFLFGWCPRAPMQYIYCVYILFSQLNQIHLRTYFTTFQTSIQSNNFINSILIHTYVYTFQFSIWHSNQSSSIYFLSHFTTFDA